MKRVYTEDYLNRRSRRKPVRRSKADTPRTAAPVRARPEGPGERGRPDARVRVSGVKKTRAAAVGVLALLVFLFFVSCLLALADANAGPTVAETLKEYKAPPGTKDAAPGVWADAAVLTDLDSGRVLYDKNAHSRLPMASTTKMMTALVVRARCGLKERVEITPEAVQVGEESINLIAGETLTVEQLLNVMLIQSANDAAFALAQHAGGSPDAFAGLMNKMAADIGARDSHFTNPHGLDQGDHYSSAYDLALIGRAVMRDPVLARIVSTPKYSIPTPGQPWDRVAVGHNEILARYQGADGIKTGYTGKAGMCLAASAKRDGKGLIAVVLNSSHRADDVSALFNYGFGNTARLVFSGKGQKLGRCRVSSFPRRSVGVVSGGDLASLTFVGSGDVFKVTTAVQRSAGSPVRAGQKLGTITVTLDNSAFAGVEAVAARAQSGSNLPGAIWAFFWYSACWMGRIISAPFRIF